MNHAAGLRYPVRVWASLAGILCSAITPWTALATENDWTIPEEFSYPKPLQISEGSEKMARAQAYYLQALLDEETDGPEKALASKREVLNWDPGFTALSVEVAQHLLRGGDTAEALSVLKDATKAAPHEDAPTHALAGIYLRQLQKPALAEKFALQALERNPNDPTIYETLWEIYRSTGQNQKIENLIQKASRSDSKDYLYWLGIADIRIRDSTRANGKSNEAVLDRIASLVDKAAKLTGEEPEAIAKTADYYTLCKRNEEAKVLYRKALAANGNLPGIREKLADCLIQEGDSDEAARILEEIIKQNPLYLAAYDQLARIDLEQGNPVAAMSNMRQALLLAPIDPRRQEEIIHTAFRAGEYETALQFAIEGEKKFPFMLGFTLLRAVALSQKQDHPAALLAFERTLVEASISSPEILDAAFYISYGSAAEKAGDHVKAAELLKKAIALDPLNSAEACNYLGYMWAERNENLDEAERLIMQAVQLDPSNGAYMDSLGWVWLCQGKFSKALAELMRAAEAMKNPDPVIFEHIGDAHEKLGRTADALHYWQKALQLETHNTSLAEKIDRNASKVARQPTDKTTARP
ncbi:MAG: tetratricopeptide repeat protein [bacterium]